MKIAIVLGTRPEIIKFSPIIRLFEKEKIDYFVIHSGQHYSYTLDKIFFEELNLPQPKYNLNVGSGSHAEQTGKILIGVEKILLDEKPDIVLVQGDTNTTLAGSLAASKLHIKIGHVEAGLRSYDKFMPEEINRVLTDHISDYLFAPTQISKENLLREGMMPDKIFITGNTIVDALYQNLALAERRSDILKKLGLKPKKYFLLTLHRQENVDSKERLIMILKGIKLVYETFNIPIIFPIHPRTYKQIRKLKLNINTFLKVTTPFGFLEFLQLEKNAKLIFTDSGGVQEESCILHVPCVTLRNNTERPETIIVGANILAGINPTKILYSAKEMLKRSNTWQNPFGDGNSAKKILEILLNKLD